MIKEEDKGTTTRLGVAKEALNVDSRAISAEEADSKKPIVCKDRNIDLQLDLEKTTDRDGATANVGANNKLHQNVQKQPPPQPGSDKAGSAGRCPFSNTSLVLVEVGLLLIQC